MPTLWDHCLWKEKRCPLIGGQIFLLLTMFTFQVHPKYWIQISLVIPLKNEWCYKLSIHGSNGEPIFFLSALLYDLFFNILEWNDCVVFSEFLCYLICLGARSLHAFYCILDASKQFDVGKLLYLYVPYKVVIVPLEVCNQIRKHVTVADSWIRLT